MKYEKIIYEKDGNIGRITLNYPEKLNTWDFPGQGGMSDQFDGALKEAVDDDDIKVVVIKGAGRCLSAGHDLTKVGFVYGMGTGKQGERRASQRARLKVDHKFIAEHLQNIFLCPKITLVQVHGYCYGEGVELVNCCDLAIAAEDAQFARIEQRLGFAGASAELTLSIIHIGLKRTLGLMLTGDTIDGKEAERLGMINKAVPADQLEEEVNKVAEKICLLPRDGIALGKSIRHLTYDALQLTTGFTRSYVGHSFATNLRWEPDEYNFFKERRDKGAKEGFHARDDRYKKT